MNADSDRALHERFLALADLEPEPRRRALAELRDVDPDGADRLARLLARDASGHPALDRDPPARGGLVGQQLGDYRIDELIGHGGMGTVYRARQLSLGRDIALKLLRLGGDTEVALRRFANEARLLARLDHRHIATVHDTGVFELDGTEVPYYALELVADGEPITTFCRRRRESVETRLRRFVSACDAVEAAHRQRVVHRDLKPENVLVDRSGTVKLIDFGVAKAHQRITVLHTVDTVPGQIVGTLGYIAPEVLRSEADVADERSDVFSLGVLLFELLAERPPFDVHHGTPRQAVRSLLLEPAMRLSAVRPAYRGPLETITATAMAEHPRNRYATAGALAADVRAYLTGDRIRARPAPAPRRAWRWVRRHPWVTSSLCAAGLVATTASVLAVLVWLGTRRPHALVENGDDLVLESRSGDVLHRWPGLGGAEATIVRDPSIDARVVIRCENESGDEQAGHVVVSRLDSPHVVDWSTRDRPLSAPSRLTDRPGVFPTVAVLEVVDCFADEPGPELLIVNRLGIQRESCIRVFTLDGRLLYRVWHEGAVRSAHRVPATGQLVFATRVAYSWGERGVGSLAAYPAAVFALLPVRDHLGDLPGIVHEGAYRDPTLCWYRVLAPPAAAAALEPMQVIVAAANVDARGLVDLRLHPWVDNEPVMIGSFAFDAEGTELREARVRANNYETGTGGVRRPPFESLEFIDYGDLPQPTNPTGR